MKQDGAGMMAMERELVQRLRQGDEAAFDSLVRQHAGRLLQVVGRYLKDEDEARDAVQESFLAAFRNLAGFRADSRLSTWLHRIAVNTALMRLRHRRRHPEEPIEDLLPRFDERGVSRVFPRAWRWTAQRLLEQKETRRAVRQSINQLPESYRLVLLLRDIEEYDTEETARLLGLSTAAVKVRLHRARLALRSLLAARYEVEES